MIENVNPIEDHISFRGDRQAVKLSAGSSSMPMRACGCELSHHWTVLRGIQELYSNTTILHACMKRSKLTMSFRPSQRTTSECLRCHCVSTAIIFNVRSRIYPTVLMLGLINISLGKPQATSCRCPSQRCCDALSTSIHVIIVPFRINLADVGILTFVPTWLPKLIFHCLDS